MVQSLQLLMVFLDWGLGRFRLQILAAMVMKPACSTVPTKVLGYASTMPRMLEWTVWVDLNVSFV